MALQAQRLYALAEHGIFGSIESVVGRQNIVNLAGEHMVNMHEWSWLVRPWDGMTVRPKITLAGATWTETSPALTLTKNGAFASYTFYEGDQVEVTGGAAATKGYYNVASRTSANAIVLEKSIGAAADADTDIAGTMDLSLVALPNGGNVRNLLAYTAEDRLTNRLRIVSYEELAQLRAGVTVLGSWQWAAAIVYGKGQPDGAPTPYLDIHPVPTTEQANELKAFYIAGWTEVTDETDVIQIPTWMEGFFIHVVREYARAFDDDERVSLDQRLLQLEVSPLFVRARKRDSELAPDLGKVRGGAGLSAGRRGWRPFLATPVDAPS